MSTPRKQVILAAHFPGVNNHTVWSDPDAGSQIAAAPSQGSSHGR